MGIFFLAILISLATHASFFFYFYSVTVSVAIRTAVTYIENKKTEANKEEKKVAMVGVRTQHPRFLSRVHYHYASGFPSNHLP